MAGSRGLLLAVFLGASGASALLGSSITSTTTPSYTSSTGTVGYYDVTSYGTGFGSTTSSLTAMTGLQIVVTYSNSTTASCTWTTTSTTAGDCVSTGNFTVSGTNGSISGTYNGTWTLTDSKSGVDISSVTFYGSGAGNTAGGLTSFNLCGTYSGTYPTGAFTPNYYNSGASTTCGGATGTPNSSYGWSAGTPTASGGTTGLAPNSITYTNAVAEPGNNPVGDEFSKVIFGFCTVSNGSAPCNSTSNVFASGDSITWRMDTDSLVATTPEPATLSLVGISLLGLGGLRLRRKKNT